MATSLKNTETRDELSITLYLQYEINTSSVRMPVNAWCYIPTSLPISRCTIMMIVLGDSDVGM